MMLHKILISIGLLIAILIVWLGLSLLINWLWEKVADPPQEEDEAEEETDRYENEESEEDGNEGV